MPGMAIRNWLVRLMRGRQAMRGFYSPRHTPVHDDSPQTSHSTAPWSGCRRDLRADDHAALHHALRAARAGVVRLRVRPRHPRPAAALPTGAWSSSATAWSARRRTARAGGVARRGGRGLIVRHGRAATRTSRRWPPRCGVQAVYANHDDEPAALARDAARARARWPTRGIALHTVQGPRDLRAQRGADARPAGRLRRVHAVQERLAEEAGALLPEGLPGGARTPRALAPPPAGDGTACRRWPSIGFEPTNLHALQARPAGTAGAQRAAGRLPASASTATTRRATSPPSRGRAT